MRAKVTRVDQPARVAMLSVHTSPMEQPGTGDAGGLNVYVVETAKRLAERGTEVEIFTRATSSDQPSLATLVPGVAVRHIVAGPFEGLSKNDLPDRDLAVFVAHTPQMAAYRRDLFWAQDYARRNRAVMLALLQDVVRGVFAGARVSFGEPISCHHNYVAEEVHDGVEVLVTRKGAIRAGAGDLGIIPGSMGTGSYIVRGLGNPASFCSASHGAGRRMSRNKARKTFTEADLAAQTAGVECRKDSGVVDEIPGAYKDVREVIAAQSDLVEVVHQLRQVVCVKG